MRIIVLGGTHLAQTLAKASQIRHHDLVVDGGAVDVVFVAHDVLDHRHINDVNAWMASAILFPNDIPIVICSQVPPGFTRKWAAKRKNIFYQVDTIIMDRALDRASNPEQFIIGCENPQDRLPDAYSKYLMAFGPPVHKMSYESAELAKLAINYMLSKQIEAANHIADVAAKIGANYDDMIPALRGDYRIKDGYIIPGTINQHLRRDVDTITRIFLHGRPYRRRRQPNRQGAGAKVAGAREDGRGDDPQVAARNGNAAV